MITTKRKSFLLVLSLLLVLSACGGGDDSTTEEVVETAGEEESLDSPATTAAAAEPEVKKLKVGLVVGALGDRSFMDSAKRGFDQAVAELPIEGDFIEAEEAERAQAYANFIADGKDLIIGISFSEAGRILEAATANPDLSLIHI